MGVISFFLSYIGSWLKSWFFLFVIASLFLIVNAGCLLTGSDFFSVSIAPLLNGVLSFDLGNLSDYLKWLLFFLVGLPLVGFVGSAIYAFVRSKKGFGEDVRFLITNSFLLILLDTVSSFVIFRVNHGFWSSIGLAVVVLIVFFIFAFLALLLFAVANTGNWVKSFSQSIDADFRVR